MLCTPSHAPSPTSPASANEAPFVPTGRNLAIDAMRVVAMCCVAFGHWLAADVRVGADGTLGGGNALNSLLGIHWITWIFQVMPLFFFVGGFSNASSLASSAKRGGHEASWVAARLMRLLRPTAVFAAIWLGVDALASAGGQHAMVAKASQVAAIPLWFLAVYVMDICMAPVLARIAKRLGGRVVALPLIIVGLDVARQAHVPYVSVLQVVFGWTVFQALGMAWHANTLSRRMAAILAPLAFAAALLGVAIGPWPVSLVSVLGAQIGNTWPPSPVLLAFGMAQCMIAFLLAPSIDTWLRTHLRALAALSVAGKYSMTIYLWHLTAFSIVGVVGALTGALGSSTIGSGSWWLSKAVLIGCSIPALALIAFVVGRFEHAKASLQWPRIHWATVVPLVGGLAWSFHQLTEFGLTTAKSTIGTMFICASAVALRTGADHPTR